MSKTKTKKAPKAKEIDTEIEGTFSCISCMGPEYVKVRDLPTQDFGGVKCGEAFNHIERAIVKCVQCDQHSILFRYTK